MTANLAVGQPLDTAMAVQLGAKALIGLLVDDPEIYGFIVRSMRASDRGVLDNPSFGRCTTGCRC